jgi:hypothetical protein
VDDFGCEFHRGEEERRRGGEEELRGLGVEGFNRGRGYNRHRVHAVFEMIEMEALRV